MQVNLLQTYTSTAMTVLWSLYRSSCITWHP